MNPGGSHTELSRCVRPLVRPPILDDEWLQGYLARVAVLYGSRPVLRDQVQQSETELSGLLCASQARLHRSGDEAGPGRRYLGPFKVADWLMREVQTSVPICHSCFRESPHIRMGWRLRYAYTCEKHGTLLNNTCPQCERRWFAHDCAIGICGCGFELRCCDHEKRAEPLLRHQLGLTADLCISALAPPVDGDTLLTMKDPIADHLAILLFQHSILGILKRDSLRLRNEFGGKRPIDMPRMSINPGNGPWPLDNLIEVTRNANNLYSIPSLFSRLKRTETYAPTLISRLPLNDWSYQARHAYACRDTNPTPAAVRPASADAKLDGLNDRSLGLKPSGFRALQQVDEQFRLARRTSESTEFKPVELLDQLDQIAICHVDRSCQMVRLSSSELWNIRFAASIPSYFERMLQGWCWVFSDQRSAGFARFLIERDAFNRMRKELGTAFRWTRTAIEQRDFFGTSDLMEAPEPRTWDVSRQDCTRLHRRRARHRKSHPGQLPLWF